MAEIGRLVAVIDGDTSGLQRALNDAKGQLSNIGKTATDAGRALTLGLTAPIVAIGGAATKMGNEFNSELDKIVGLVGVARDQVNAWKDDIFDLSRATAVGPKELAEALFFVTSAGFRGAEAMDVLEMSAKAAAAGLGQTATIADAVTSAINAYGSENLSAARATDILVAAVREGKLEASALAPVLGNLLPIASAMGIGFEEVAGVLAAMSKTGTGAAEGATQLGAVMSALLKPSAGAQKALAKVGLEFKDLREMASRPGGLIEVMRLLEKAFEGNEEGLAQVIPNIRAFRGVMNLLAQDADSVQSVLDGVANSTGSLDKAFAAVAEGPGFKFRQGINEIRVELTRLGDVLGPILADTLVPLFRRAVGAFGALVTAFRGLPPVGQQVIVVFGLILASLGPALLMAGQFAFAIRNLIPAIGALQRAMHGLSLASLTNPWVLAAAAAAALGVALYLLIKNFDDVKAAVSRFATDFHSRVTGALNAVGSFIESWPVALLFMGPFAPVVALAADVFGVRTALVNGIKRLFQEVKAGWDDLTHLFKLGLEGGAISDFGFSALERAAFNAGQAIRTVGQRAGDAIGSVRDFANRVGGALSSAVHLFQLGFQGGMIGGNWSALETFAFNLGKAFKDARDFAQGVFDAIRNAQVPDRLNRLVEAFMAGFRGTDLGQPTTPPLPTEPGLVPGVPGTEEHIKALDALDRLIKNVGAGLKHFKDDMIAAWDAIRQGFINPMIEAFEVAIPAVVNNFLEALSSFKDDMVTLFNFVKDNAITPMIAAFQEVAEFVGNTFLTAFRNFIEDMKTLVSGLVDVAEGIAEGIEGAFNVLKKAIDGITRYVIDQVNRMIAGINSVISAANRLPGINIGPIPQIARPPSSQEMNDALAAGLRSGTLIWADEPGGAIIPNPNPPPTSIGPFTQFHKGAWTVPEDMLALLERDEMVVPAFEAEAFRRGFNGEQGQTIEVHNHGTVYAVDDLEARIRRAVKDALWLGGAPALARSRGMA